MIKQSALEIQDFAARFVLTPLKPYKSAVPLESVGREFDLPFFAFNIAGGLQAKSWQWQWEGHRVRRVRLVCVVAFYCVLEWSRDNVVYAGIAT